LVPRIPTGSAILLDNSGLLAVGLGIADYFRRELDCDPVDVPSVEARDFYDEDPGLIATRLQTDARLERPVVIVSSIVSSGRSLDAMSRACRDAGFVDVQSLILFGADGTASTDEPVHMLAMDLTREDANDCRSCTEDRKPVVRIRRSTGLVEVSALVTKARITMSAGAQAASFFSRYAEVDGVVSVHKDQHDSRRHHVIDISVSTLVAEPAFAQRVESSLSPHAGRRVVVLHPEHDDAEALASLVGRVLDAIAIIRCDPTSLGQLAVEERQALADAELILVVDDVAITGTRMRQYRAHLNLHHIVDGKGIPEVGAFVGVLRPSSGDRREAILDLGDRPTRLLFAEELILPDWREPDCPWCHEYEQLRRARVARGSLMDARKSQLEKGGLTTELFLPFNVEQGPGSHGQLLGMFDPEVADPGDPMDLGPRSVFGELRDESQVFVAVASALQFMRDHADNNALSETYTSPISRVLAPDFYVSGRFYAPVILCSILRAARRFDLRATAIEPKLRQAVGERFSDLPAIRAEMLYAMYRGVLPMPTEAADRAMISEMDSSVSAFFRWFGGSATR